MATRKHLSGDDLSKAMEDLTGWALSDSGKALKKQFKFDGFPAAFGFMTRIALVAQRMDHHPDWSNSYATVDVTLSTHDAGGITALDIKLAAEMDAAA